MSDPVVKPAKPENIGTTLYNILTKLDPYKGQSDVNQFDKPEKIKLVRDYITEVYTKYLNVQVDIDKSKPVATNQLRSGDIIIHSDRVYLVTLSLPSTFYTWPTLIPKDQKALKLDHGIKSYNIIRPDLSIVSNSFLEEIDDIISEPAETPEENESKKTSETFVAGKLETLSDGYLQIGDLGFLVDPTQLAFTTQNGYHFFPTIRTAGNPKIPTAQQIKNISISLIFPNEDSINHQLLNLFAMFKRTPFVNIRNKDICAFFKDICFGEEWPQQWLSVALESIQIQSVSGFPNTLQAQITLLPFDALAVNGRLQALRSFKDVKEQQDLLYANKELESLIKKSEEKLFDNRLITDRAEDIIDVDIDKSPNFKESLPFRAFYQSLISERQVVTDEHGNPVPVFSRGERTRDSFPLDGYRPTNRENLLHEYRASANQKQIGFRYRYINGDLRQISTDISNDRFGVQTETIKKLNEAAKLLETPQNLVQQMVNTFVTGEDYFREMTYKFDQYKRSIPTLLARNGITLDQQDPAKPIENIMDLFFRGLGRRLGIEQVGTVYSQLNEIAQGNFSKDETDVLGLLRGLIYTDVGGTSIENINGVTTAREAINKIWAWIDVGTEKEKERKKKQFLSFLDTVRQSILADLGVGDDNLVIVDPKSNGEIFNTYRLPLAEDTVTINNRQDVAVSWTVTFANKFIPIMLTAHKYPYYQHIGHDDVGLSLNITSTSSDLAEDLKTKFSLLSERLQETVKVVTYTAPELITYLDSRLTIDVPDNHVFKVFGVDKVVYDNSNSVNISEQPGSWNTNIQFTQAKFTIADYHSIDQEFTEDVETGELAKLLAKTEIGEDGKFIVRRYTIKNETSRTKTSENEKEVPDTRPATLDEILRFRFYNSKPGEKLQAYLDSVIKESVTSLARAEARERRARYALEGMAAAHAGEIITLPEEEFNFGDFVVSEDLLSKIDKQHANITAQVADVVNIDHGATNTLNRLIQEEPEVGKIVKFIISKINGVMEQQGEILTNIIHPNRSALQRISDVLLSRNGSLVTGVSALLCTAIFFSALPLWIPIVASVGAFIGVAGLTGSDVIANITKDKVVESASDGMNGLLEQYNASLVSRLAKRVLRDPVIKNKIFNIETVGSKVIELVEEHKIGKIVNCYKDFDIPSQIGDVLLSPDFYLFNELGNRYAISTYVSSAIERLAKIGKLHALISLVESKEAVQRYNEIITAANSLDDGVQNGIKEVLNHSFDVEDSVELIDKLQNMQITLSRAVTSTDDNKIGDQDITLILDEYKKLRPRENAPNKDIWDEEFAQFKDSLEKSKVSLAYDNMDFRRMNLIEAARITTLIEIFEMYKPINEYYKSNLDAISGPGQSLPVDKEEKYTKLGSESNAAKKIFEHITAVLKNAQNLTTQTMMDPGNKFGDDANAIKEINDKFNKGKVSKAYEDGYLSLPNIKMLQSQIYNKISYYVRLNSFIHEKGDGNYGDLNLDSLPELKFIKFWNWRTKEDTDRQSEYLRDFLKQNKYQQDTTIKMFPTYKIYFIEEDKTFMPRNLDDYFSYDAIQSIEIVSNKDTPGTTAVLRLSNVTNTLTDKLSFHRERAEAFGQVSTGPKDDNLFFGTLDIKPGTAMVIKMGYGPHDSMLETVFQGRIIEMNPGPMVEMVCQSYGTQLNHHVVSEKFGLLSTAGDHGDVASAILDIIPGLEKLGKISMTGSVVDSDFTGRNIRNLRGKAIDKFFLSNILGNLTPLMFAQDNPRDENIYLPYSYITSAWHKPTFDWVVFDQTVWEALQEICLYHRNTIATLRPFNNDPISKKRDTRETLVVGKKSGFYKYTDAFSLSNIDTKKIDSIVEEYEKLVVKFKNPRDLGVGKNVVTQSYFHPEFSDGLNKVYTIRENLIEFFRFFQDRENALIATYHILSSRRTVDGAANAFDILINQISDNSIFPSDYSRLVTNLLRFSGIANIKEDEIAGFDFAQTETYWEIANVFTAIINDYVSVMTAKNPLSTDFSPEEFYNVKNIIDNDDEKKFLDDPQYKRIQTHHLVSDVSNLISNNISLSTNFPNVVNVFYTDEPSIETSRIENMKDSFIQKHLHSWQCKAFGDIKDEHARVLNSYQKNIDTNWYDTIEKTESLLGGYKRIKERDGNKWLENVRKLFPIIGDMDPKKLHTPSWAYLPSFAIVAVRLLERNIEKMYQGTIEVVGSPQIKPYDILHLDDRINDMKGTVEVQEVIHTFTPDRGFRTVITPNLITYDRDPIQMQDVSVINQIYDYAEVRRRNELISAGIGAGMVVGGTLGAVGGQVITGSAVAIGGAAMAWNGTVNAAKRHHKFIYDMAGNIFGRDCINFSALTYHGAPFMAGFDGVDYTSLKTLVNHNVLGIKSPIARYAAFKDPLRANIITNFNPENTNILGFFLSYVPLVNGFTGAEGQSGFKWGMFDWLTHAPENIGTRY